MRRPIAISLSPNSEHDDALQSLKLLFSPWSWKEGICVRKLEQWFSDYFQAHTAVSFSSGRAAMIAILQAYGIGRDDEVLLQAFTCVAVPNAIISAGAKPIYVDANNSFTIDFLLLEKKITKMTKAIIAQHTFGIPSQMEKIIEIAKKHDLLVIEDCAHTIGGVLNGKKLGQFGDAAFFSFGRDKSFSSVFGGVAITNDGDIGKKMRDFQDTLSTPSHFWIMQQLLHPIAFSLILPLYNFFSIGKILLVLLQKFRLLSFPVTAIEKKGKTDAQFIKKMPNALSCLANHQLGKVTRYNKKREEISDYYIQHLNKDFFAFPFSIALPFLRFPVIVPKHKRGEIISYLKRYGIYLGTWYASIIDPKGTSFDLIGYEKGTAKNAERFANEVINLPTYPTMREHDMVRVVDKLNAYAKR